GGLLTSKWPGQCQSGLMGYATNYGANIPAIFTGPPLAAPMTVGGTVTVKFYLTDPAQSAWASAGQNPRLDVEIDAVDANGNLILPLGAGEWHVCNNGVCNSGTTPTAGTYTMSIPGATVPAGARLSIVVRQTAAVTSTSRTVYGGAGLTANYSDAGVTLTTGTLQ